MSWSADFNGCTQSVLFTTMMTGGHIAVLHRWTFPDEMVVNVSALGRRAGVHTRGSHHLWLTENEFIVEHSPNSPEIYEDSSIVIIENPNPRETDR